MTASAGGDDAGLVYTVNGRASAKCHRDMRPPRLLDLFCGAGGAGMGYHRAGFEVAGADVVPQPPPHHHWGPAISIAGHGTPAWMRARTGHLGVAEWRQVMGIGWTTRQELTEAIPPACTDLTGRALLDHMATRRAA